MLFNRGRVTGPCLMLFNSRHREVSDFAETGTEGTSDVFEMCAE